MKRVIAFLLCAGMMCGCGKKSPTAPTVNPLPWDQSLTITNVSVVKIPPDSLKLSVDVKWYSPRAPVYNITVICWTCNGDTVFYSTRPQTLNSGEAITMSYSGWCSSGKWVFTIEGHYAGEGCNGGDVTNKLSGSVAHNELSC